MGGREHFLSLLKKKGQSHIFTYFAEYFALNRRFCPHFPAAVINSPRAVGAPKPPLAALIKLMPRRTSAFLLDGKNLGSHRQPLQEKVWENILVK
jgi:hypothetical protein